MKPIKLILLFLICQVSSFSQVIKEWQFDSFDAYNYYPTTDIIHNGQFTFVCSQTYPSTDIAYILKLDASGNLVSQDTVHDFTFSILKTKRMVRDVYGSIYVCGSRLNASLEGKMILIKYDSLLNRQWLITVNDSDSSYYRARGLLYSESANRINLIGESTDSTFINHIITINYDSSGTEMWEYLDTLSYGLSLIDFDIDNSGNVFLGGYGVLDGFVTGEDLMVIKINNDGTIGWFHRENGSNNDDDWMLDMAIDKENNIFSSGYFEDSVRYKLQKLDPAGNLVWTGDLNNIGLNKIAVDKAGSIYVAGFDTIPSHEFVVMKFDSSGNFINSNFSDVPGYNGYFSDYLVDIQTNDSADVYVLNNVDSAGTMKWVVGKMDSTLNLKWSFVYPDTSSINGRTSFICLVDEGFIVSGSQYNYLSVIRFHETFPTGISEITKKENIIHWPNPTNDKLNFITNEIVTGKIDFKLYDINSKIVFENTINVAGENTFFVKLPQISEGVYFYTAQIGSRKFMDKIIIANQK